MQCSAVSSQVPSRRMRPHTRAEELGRAKPVLISHTITRLHALEKADVWSHNMHPCKFVVGLVNPCCLLRVHPEASKPDLADAQVTRSQSSRSGQSLQRGVMASLCICSPSAGSAPQIGLHERILRLFPSQPMVSHLDHSQRAFQPPLRVVELRWQELNLPASNGHV